MLNKPFALALMGAALVAGPVLAQTSQPPSPTPPATTTTTTQAPPAGNWMTQEKPGQWRASKMTGLNVYNNNNERIGDINELLVDQSGKIEAVVIGVGGFLGIGERDVAVPFNEIKFVEEPRATAAVTTAPPASPTAPPMATSPNATTTGTVATPRTAPADTTRASPDHAVLNMTRDQLRAAPEFRYAR